MPRAQAILKNILAILLGVTLVPGSLEIMLRVFQPMQSRVKGNRAEKKVSPSAATNPW
jgi:hypothetical protein